MEEWRAMFPLAVLRNVEDVFVVCFGERETSSLECSSFESES